MESLGIGLQLNPQALTGLLLRYLLNVAIVYFLVMCVYLKHHKNREFAFTAIIVNLITFTICMVLQKVSMQMGFALGLFGVFGILRYRTEEIRLHDLTYLFIVIGIAILNSLTNQDVSIYEWLIVNGIILGSVWALEQKNQRSGTGSMFMVYDNVDLLHPNRQEEFYQDLQKRFGMTIKKVSIRKIDLLRDSAEIVVEFEHVSI